MPKTRIADVIVPEVFNPYVVQQTAELSALYQSGIVATSDELNSLAASRGAASSTCRSGTTWTATTRSSRTLPRSTSSGSPPARTSPRSSCVGKPGP